MKRQGTSWLIALGLLLFAGAASAYPLVLTANGLGMSSGNYGTAWAVDDFVTISARSNWGFSGLPAFLPGTVFLASDDRGIGVQDWFGGVSGQINADRRECIDFNLAAMTEASEISVGLNKYRSSDDVVVYLEGGGNSIAIDDQSVINNAFTSTGYQRGILDLGLIADAANFGEVSKVTVQADHGRFYIDRFAVKPGAGDPTNPVPEPASLVLLGTGLLGVIGARKLRRSR